MVAVTPPNHHPGQSRSGHLEHGEIADAALVVAAAVVNHHYLAGRRHVEGLQEHVDRSIVPHGAHRPCHLHGGGDGVESRRGQPKRLTQPDQGIAEKRCGEPGKALRHDHVSQGRGVR